MCELLLLVESILRGVEDSRSSRLTTEEYKALALKLQQATVQQQRRAEVLRMAW